MDKPIQLPAILTGFATKVDGGASVRFSTNELTDNDVLELKRRQGKFGFLLFKENEFTTNDLPKEQAEDKNKTPSKRLRAVLFVMWQQKGKPAGDFESYYLYQMDKIIEHYKTGLDQN